MKSNQINGIILLVLGFWGYYLTSDLMLLIPTISGVMLLIFNLFLRKGDKVLSYAIAGITILVILFLFYYLVFLLFNSDFISILRVLTMLFSCIVSIVIFMKSIQQDNHQITLGKNK